MDVCACKKCGRSFLWPARWVKEKICSFFSPGIVKMSFRDFLGCSSHPPCVICCQRRVKVKGVKTSPIFMTPGKKGLFSDYLSRGSSPETFHRPWRGYFTLSYDLTKTSFSNFRAPPVQSVERIFTRPSSEMIPNIFSCLRGRFTQVKGKTRGKGSGQRAHLVREKEDQG